MSTETENQMARDLDLIDAVEVLGRKAAIRGARKQRRAIFREIAAMNARDGLADISDEELCRLLEC